eukprot:7382943-Alexandrium_andersonii.AAC.1
MFRNLLDICVQPLGARRGHQQSSAVDILARGIGSWQGHVLEERCDLGQMRLALVVPAAGVCCVRTNPVDFQRHTARASTVM